MWIDGIPHWLLALYAVSVTAATYSRSHAESGFERVSRERAVGLLSNPDDAWMVQGRMGSDGS